MRSLLGFLAFVAGLIVLVAAFAVPALVAPIVSSAVRAASPFGDQPLDIQVDVDAIGLIRGFVGEIRISGTGLEKNDARIGSLALTVKGVGIGDHAFAAIEGGLDAVTVPFGDGAPLVIDRVELSGASDTVSALAHLDRAEAIAFIERSMTDQGLAASGVELVDGGVLLVIFEQRVEVVVGVEDGVLVVPDMLGAGSVELLAPLPGDPWRLTGVSITPDGMEIRAQVDATRVLASG